MFKTSGLLLKIRNLNELTLIKKIIRVNKLTVHLDPPSRANIYIKNFCKHLMAFLSRRCSKWGFLQNNHYSYKVTFSSSFCTKKKKRPSHPNLFCHTSVSSITTSMNVLCGLPLFLVPGDFIVNMHVQTCSASSPKQST